MNKKPHSEEAKRKMRLAHLGKPAWNKGIKLWEGKEHPRGMLGKKLSEETKKKIGLSNKGKSLSEETKRKISLAKKGKIVSEETKRKISLTLTGRKLSEETKGKIRENANTNLNFGMKGKHPSEETKRKLHYNYINNPNMGMKGKKHSEETKGKMSLKAKGKIVSEETRRKISLSNKGRISWNKGKKEKRIEVLIKQSNSHKGKKFSDERIKKMSLARKGISYISEAGKIRISLAKKGKSLSEETKRKISLAKKGIKTKPCPENIKVKIKNAQLGKFIPIETRRKMSLARKGKKLSPQLRLLAIKNLKPNPKGSTLSEETKRKIREKRKNQSPVYTSSIENKIRNFLEELKIEYHQHKYMNIEHGYQCDIFVPSKSLVIECDGDYWHGNPSIYPAKILIERQKERKITDSIRTKELIEKGYSVLRLWESEINKMNLSEFIDKLERVGQNPNQNTEELNNTSKG